jgi:cell division protein ZapA
MPQVAVRIANRTYDLACGEGEEQRVLDLASYVEEKMSILQKQIPGAPEIKLLVLTALLLAEESREARSVAAQARSASETAVDKAETLASTLEELITTRVDKMQKRVTGAA